jgi:hypothetical protein
MSEGSNTSNGETPAPPDQYDTGEAIIPSVCPCVTCTQASYRVAWERLIKTFRIKSDELAKVACDRDDALRIGLHYRRELERAVLERNKALDEANVLRRDLNEVLQKASKLQTDNAELRRNDAHLKLCRGAAEHDARRANAALEKERNRVAEQDAELDAAAEELEQVRAAYRGLLAIFNNIPAVAAALAQPRPDDPCHPFGPTPILFLPVNPGDGPTVALRTNEDLHVTVCDVAEVTITF